MDPHLRVVIARMELVMAMTLACPEDPLAVIRELRYLVLRDMLNIPDGTPLYDLKETVAIFKDLVVPYLAGHRSVVDAEMEPNIRDGVSGLITKVQDTPDVHCPQCYCRGRTDCMCVCHAKP